MARSIAVVGAGVFGLTSAIELRKRKWDVTLLDPGPVPRAAAASTDISKVVRMDYGADELYTEMCEAALAGWDLWNATWPSALYHQDGFLLLTERPMAAGGFEHESFSVLRRRGHAPERVDATAIASRFAGWRAGKYRDGYLSLRAGWAESGRTVARLAAIARDEGVRFMEGASLECLIETDGGIGGVRTTDGGAVHADVVLVAAGAWTPAILPHLGGVMWTTGQPVVHFKVANPAEWQAPRFPVWAADISRTGWYGFPALDDGTLKIGHHGPGRRVHPDEPRTVLAPEIDAFRDFVRGSLPALENVPIVASRLCLYCDTFDGDFWIGHDTERAGLVVAAGDSGHGFKFAPVLGSTIADAIEGRQNPWTSRFAPRPRVRDALEAARFGIRD